MKMKLETRLTQEVENQIEDISKMELGSDKYKVTVEGVTQLTGKIIELRKTDYEYRENLFNQEMEIKKQEMELERYKVDKWDRWIKNTLTAVGIVAPLGCAIWANVYNWPKEEVDTMLKSGGRESMRFLLGGFRRK